MRTSVVTAWLLASPVVASANQYEAAETAMTERAPILAQVRYLDGAFRGTVPVGGPNENAWGMSVGLEVPMPHGFSLISEGQVITSDYFDPRLVHNAWITERRYDVMFGVDYRIVGSPQGVFLWSVFGGPDSMTRSSFVNRHWLLGLRGGTLLDFSLRRRVMIQFVGSGTPRIIGFDDHADGKKDAGDTRGIVRYGGLIGVCGAPFGSNQIVRASSQPVCGAVGYTGEAMFFEDARRYLDAIDLRLRIRF